MFSGTFIWKASVNQRSCGLFHPPFLLLTRTLSSNNPFKERLKNQAREKERRNQNKEGKRRREKFQWWNRLKELVPTDRKVFLNLLFCAAGMTTASVYFHFRKIGVQISWKDFVERYLSKGLVGRMEVVNKEYVKAFPADGVSSSNVSYLWFNIGGVNSFERNLELAQQEIDPNIVPVLYTTENNRRMFFSALPSLVLVAFLLFASRQGPVVGASGGKFKGNPFKMSKSKATIVKVDTGVRLEDVAGCEEAKLEVLEFVNFLKNPDRYSALGARTPKGALLCGPPGTGKTLLAKATAGETGLPFITASGSEFLEVFVGVGPARIRDLFARARSISPCIVFIDEIDAVGRRRSAGSFDCQTEQENTLNQLLVEMDGFNSSANVAVLAGTNRADILDPALMRPGRFDRHIYLGPPDFKSRVSIFKVHLKPLKLSRSIDSQALSWKLAALTPGFTGADIAGVCNDAALIAARHLHGCISSEHLEQAVERFTGGPEKKTQVMQLPEKTAVAYHEAGHIVTSWFLQHADLIFKVSIVPRGKGAGRSQCLSAERHLFSREQLFDRMCVMLSGRVAEQVFLHQVTTRGQADLKRATELAYAQVIQFGMNKAVGPICFDLPQPTHSLRERPFGESTARLIDLEVRSLIDAAFQRTRLLLVDKKDKVEKVAKTLLRKKALGRTDLLELLGPEPFKEKHSYEEIMFVDDNWD